MAREKQARTGISTHRNPLRRVCVCVCVCVGFVKHRELEEAAVK